MRVLAVVVVLILLPWLLGSQNPSWAGAAGGLMMLVLPFLLVRGVWLFAGDLRRLGRGPR